MRIEDRLVRHQAQTPWRCSGRNAPHCLTIANYIASSQKFAIAHNRSGNR